MNYRELIAGNIFLIFGGLVLGFGVVDFNVRNIAYVIFGMFFTFIGVVYSIKSAVDGTREDNITRNAVSEISFKVPTIEKKVTHEEKTIEILQAQVNQLEKKVYTLGSRVEENKTIKYNPF